MPRRTPARDRMKKKPTVSSLKKKADAVFSLWIRTRDNGVCFTCGVQKPIPQMQNGHYITRSCNQLRYDERNNNCQCVGCNVFKSGNMPAYSLALIRKYGPSILKKLELEHRKIKQWTIPELQTIIEKYNT